MSSDPSVVDTVGGDRTPATFQHQATAEAKLLQRAMGSSPEVSFGYEDDIDHEPPAVEAAPPPEPTPEPRQDPPAEAPPVAHAALHQFLTQSADPANQRQISIGIAEVFTLHFQAAFYTNRDKTAATILAPESFELDLQHDAFYSLVIAGKNYQGQYSGAAVRLPGFPWQMLSFRITVPDGHDQTRRSAGGDDSLGDIW